MRLGRVIVVVLLVGLLAALGAYVAVALIHAPPAPQLSFRPPPRSFPKRAADLTWPDEGQAAIAVPGVGVLGEHQTERPQPIASVAKLMTAFVVLRDHPLRGRGDGPEITVTPADVQTYQGDRRLGQSTAAVAAGERLTERQALEGLLLPSANNLATLLAKWDAGSEDAFVKRMNAQARALGMARTHYADASGFRPETQSTATDQVRLASAALRRPGLAQILALKEAELPVAGTVRNLDDLLGSHGVLGGKTGSTAAAGGCFVFVARIPGPGHRVKVVGAVLGQPGVGEFAELGSAFAATKDLVESAPRQFVPLGAALGGRLVGKISSAWHKPVAVRPAAIPHLIGWAGLPLQVRIRPVGRLQAPVKAGQHVATATVRAGGQRALIPLLAQTALAKPSLGWRLTHP